MENGGKGGGKGGGKSGGKGGKGNSGGGGSVLRPARESPAGVSAGEWRCPDCNFPNRSYRTECYGCYLAAVRKQNGGDKGGGKSGGKGSKGNGGGGGPALRQVPEIPAGASTEGKG